MTEETIEHILADELDKAQAELAELREEHENLEAEMLDIQEVLAGELKLTGDTWVDVVQNVLNEREGACAALPALQRYLVHLDGHADPGAALPALQRYLVRLGYPSDPVTLDDPDLWAVYDALSG